MQFVFFRHEQHIFEFALDYNLVLRREFGDSVMRKSTAEYCQYLLSSRKSYTLTHYAEHVEGLSHDGVNRYLSQVHVRPQALWEQVKNEIVLSPDGFVVFDQTTLENFGE